MATSTTAASGGDSSSSAGGQGQGGSGDWISLAIQGVLKMIGSAIQFHQVQKTAKLTRRYAKYQNAQRMIDTLKTADIIKRQGDELVSSTQSAYADAGVDVNSGTPVDMISQEHRDINSDAAQVILRGSLENIATTSQTKLNEESLKAQARVGGLATWMSQAGQAYESASQNGWFTKRNPVSVTNNPSPTRSSSGGAANPNTYSGYA
jgi:hypothetical protein